MGNWDGFDDFGDFDSASDTLVSEPPVHEPSGLAGVDGVDSFDDRQVSRARPTATGSNHDDGIAFGDDPDFSDTAASPPSTGTAFSLPDRGSVLRTHSTREGRRTRSAAPLPDVDGEFADVLADGYAPEEMTPKQQREHERARQKEAREQRIAERRAARKAAKEVAATDHTGPGPQARAARKRRVLTAAAAAAGVAVVGTGGWALLSGSPEEPAPSPTAATAERTGSAPATPAFAAGTGCVPGTLGDGTVIANGPGDRTNPAGAIASLEHAYYTLRDGSAVTGHYVRSLNVKATTIQSGIDEYLPSNVNASYCAQISTTGDNNNVRDVQIIESRDGEQFKKISQKITTARQSDGTFKVSRNEPA